MGVRGPFRIDAPDDPAPYASGIARGLAWGRATFPTVPDPFLEGQNRRALESRKAPPRLGLCMGPEGALGRDRSPRAYGARRGRRSVVTRRPGP